eukprot:762727-Hanusia_phi.AAC.8
MPPEEDELGLILDNDQEASFLRSRYLARWLIRAAVHIGPLRLSRRTAATNYGKTVTQEPGC